MQSSYNVTEPNVNRKYCLIGLQVQLLVQHYGGGVKGDIYRRGIKQRKREQRGGERYVLLEEQSLSGQLGLQDLLEGGGGHICSVKAQGVVPPLENKV